jgi:hypothetical protein
MSTVSKGGVWRSVAKCTSVATIIALQNRDRNSLKRSFDDDSGMA